MEESNLSLAEQQNIIDRAVSELQYRFRNIIENKASWKERAVRDFFTAYKSEITEAIKAYPKVDMEGVKLLLNMRKGDMPFTKELLQARLASVILGEDVILLPRYMNNFFCQIFGVELEKGSLADGLAALAGNDVYIEFKTSNEKRLPRRINQSSSNADIVFVAVDRLTKTTGYRLSSPVAQLNIKEGFEAYITSLEDNSIYHLIKNEAVHLESLAGGPELLLNGRLFSTYAETSASLKEYLTDPENVKQFEIIGYERYQEASLNVVAETENERQSDSQSQKSFP